jgi:uncharacterized protein DUF4333
LRLAASIAASVALLLTGCGTSTTQIDSSRAERFVKHAFATPPKSVNCPSGVEAKAGGTLTCRAVVNSGRRYDVVLHMADDKGRVKVGPGDVHPVD